MKAELHLTIDQQLVIEGILLSSSMELSLIEKETQRIGRSEMPEVQRDSTITELHQRRKLARETREQNTRNVMSTEQLVIYDEKIKPSKSAIIHMGISHDRASCLICVPK